LRTLALTLTALALALGAAACGGGSGSGGSSETTSSGESGKTEIDMKDDFFDPKTITGKPGETITLELKNEGGNEHNFSLEDQGVDQDVEPQEEAEVDVTIPKSGSLTFFCEYHKSQGMTGTISAGSSSSSSTSTSPY
jgi:plastocyanin